MATTAEIARLWAKYKSLRERADLGIKISHSGPVTREKIDAMKAQIRDANEAYRAWLKA